jgi:hypothetical protein
VAPSYADVCTARAHLRALGLPTELALLVLDYAEYWPPHDFHSHPHRPSKAIAGINNGSTAAALCMVAPVFDNTTANSIREAGETPKIKSIEFEIVSRDQGWTSEDTQGTYHTSSWLEVSIARRTEHGGDVPLPESSGRLSSPLDFHQGVSSEGWQLVKRPESAERGPQGGEGDFAWYLQGNRVAKTVDGYRVFWTENESEGNVGAGRGEGFVKALRDGDRILVWARAKVCFSLICVDQFR